MKIDKDAKEKITDSVRENLKDILAQNMPEIEKFEGIEEMYENKYKSKDQALSRISNDVVQNLIQVLPQKYVSLMIENIQIDTEGAEPNVSFDSSFEINPIKPYVDFVVKVDGVEKSRKRILFEINSSGSITGNKIRFSKESKFVQLGVLNADILISLVKAPFVDLPEPKKLFEKTLEVDLSDAFE